MLLADYQPRPALVTKTTAVPTPRFPVIDAHNHLGEPFGGGWERRPIGELLERLDAAYVRHYVDLDGGWGEAILQSHLELFKAKAPDRFRVFGGVDWAQWAVQGAGFGAWAARRLEQQKAWGAEGLKIWKPFGLHVTDDGGVRAALDDPRLDPIWETAAALHWPVLIHIADPVAFFDPLDNYNERWDELGAHPDWHFPSPPFPPFLQLMDEFANLIARHPQTVFIGAHVGCYAENLTWVRALLDRCPNFYIDFSARIGELGRQPYSARRLFIDYADRILFGTDSGPDPDAYRLYYRFLESDDEYWSYDGQTVPGQGRWYIYGLHLPDDVLRKVYFGNAERLLTGSHTAA